MSSLADVLSQYTERIDEVTEKYDKKFGAINDMKSELDNLPSYAEKKGPDWVNARAAELNKKIAEKTQAADDWLATQQENLKNWLNARKTAIQNELTERAKLKTQADAEEKARLASSLK